MTATAFEREAAKQVGKLEAAFQRLLRTPGLHPASYDKFREIIDHCQKIFDLIPRSHSKREIIDRCDDLLLLVALAKFQMIKQQTGRNPR